ncbi:MAG: hypothetical protein RLZZ496_97 [Pseudomonadota bacterium]|jgi:Domain of unknown function (DUF4169)|nr:DUF4169 family protein [Alphaproteobacteria bacterium]
MAEIISFRKAKKSADRKAHDQQAVENRVRFGRTKAQKDNDRRIEERRATLLDGAKREPTDDE